MAAKGYSLIRSGSAAAAATYPPMNLGQSYICDDFLGGNGISGSIGELGWGFWSTISGGIAKGNVSVSADGGPQPNYAKTGIINIFSGSNEGQAYVFGPTLNPSIPVTSGGPEAALDDDKRVCQELGAIHQLVATGTTFLSRWKQRAQNNDSNTQMRFGYLFSTTTNNIPDEPEGFYFEKRYSDTTWQAVLKTFAGVVRVDTGISVASTTPDGNQYRTFKFEMVSETTMRFTIVGAGDAGFESDLDQLDFYVTDGFAYQVIGRFAMIGGQNTHGGKNMQLHFFDQYMTGID